MARLRLFAAAADAARCSSDEIEGTSVGQILDAASLRYGERFVEILPTCQVWLNGEPVGRHDLVGEDDEIAVLPPVSGG